jgi:hypothetical protein
VYRAGITVLILSEQKKTEIRRVVSKIQFIEQKTGLIAKHLHQLESFSYQQVLAESAVSDCEEILQEIVECQTISLWR